MPAFTIKPTGAQRTILKKAPRGAVFTPASLRMSDMSSMKEFSVLHWANAAKLYLRPAKPYHDSCFEQVFGFGTHCHDYSARRTILLEGCTVDPGRAGCGRR
jgi:hypothetical protein